MSSKPEPQFQEGDPVWFASPMLGDRPATIHERKWNSVTGEWIYRPVVHDTEAPDSEPGAYNSERHFRPRTPNE